MRAASCCQRYASHRANRNQCVSQHRARRFCERCVETVLRAWVAVWAQPPRTTILVRSRAKLEIIRADVQLTCIFCALLLVAGKDLTTLAILSRVTALQVDVHLRVLALRVVGSFILVRTNRRGVGEPTRSTGTSTAVIPKKQVPPALRSLSVSA